MHIYVFACIYVLVKDPQLVTTITGNNRTRRGKKNSSVPRVRDGGVISHSWKQIYVFPTGRVFGGKRSSLKILMPGDKSNIWNNLHFGNMQLETEYSVRDPRS